MDQRSFYCFSLQAFVIFINMKAIFFRVNIYVLLIAGILMFTGISTVASVGIVEKAEKSCCDECNEGNAQSPAHCSTLDCPMFLCLSTNMVSSFTPFISLEGVYMLQLIEEPVIKSPVRSIFHPPTIS